MGKAEARKFVAEGRIDLQPGYIVVDCSTATGGVTYEQTRHTVEEEGVGEVSRWTTRKTVDHKQVVADMDNLVKRGDWVLRKHCSRAGFGWFATADALAKVRHDMEELREAGDKLNRAAKKLGSARRVHISFVSAYIDVTNEQVAQEIYRTAADTLQAIHDALRAGLIGPELDKVMIRAKNMGNIAAGILQTALNDALSKIPEWRSEIRAAIKGKPSDEDGNGAVKGIEPAKAGKKLNLEPLEAAIQLFLPFFEQA